MPVYFIQAGETPFVKIGFSQCPERRLKRHLQHGNWEPLRIIRTIDGGFEDAAIEHWFHARFEHCHIRGEWFHLDPLMLTVEAPNMKGVGYAEYRRLKQEGRLISKKEGRA